MNASHIDPDLLQDVPMQLSPEEAVNEVVKRAVRLPTETVSLADAYGRVLANDLVSLVDHPSLDNSALDGYACREEDTLTASENNPVVLELIGDIPAGTTFSGILQPRQAVSIYTGAPIPAGADAVIGVEHTQCDGDKVKLFQPAKTDAVRPRAQDLQQGAVVLQAGTRLTAAEVGLAASMGHVEVVVVRRPRVGLLVTGDEVIAPGQPLKPGQLYDANRYTLTGLLQDVGAEIVVLDNVQDDLEVLKTRLAHLSLDFILTSGGVSMGKYDFVRDLLFHHGEVYFWKIAMRPGGPALFGSYQGVPLFGLPGNPVSCMVVFELIVKPWFVRALGLNEASKLEQRLPAFATTSFTGAGFKVAFRRAYIREKQTATGWRRVAASTGPQASNILTSMLVADGLVIVPPHHQDIAAGEDVEVILF
ncbi:MAG: gephyrin-like molybdotransferase Glp [Deinococcota bacterium]